MHHNSARKISKKNYTKAKAYCFVTLLNTLCRILEIIIAKKLNFLAMTYMLLLKLHIRRYKEILIDSIYYFFIKVVYAI